MGLYAWKKLACKEALQKEHEASGVAQQHPQNRPVCRQAEIEPRNMTPLVGSLSFCLSPIVQTPVLCSI